MKQIVSEQPKYSSFVIAHIARNSPLVDEGESTSCFFVSQAIEEITNCIIQQ